MKSIELVSRYFSYHCWAQDRCLKALSILEEPIPEALKLFAHIVSADRAWLTRLQGGDTRGMKVFTEWDIEECVAQYGEVNTAWRSYIAALDESEISRDLTYFDIKGREFTNPVVDIIMHVINHGTYHRGQIAKILRKNHIDPPATDMIVFSRNN
ncbi:DinB family protein [bacterium]|nr:DinB family protein [bacterium]